MIVLNGCRGKHLLSAPIASSIQLLSSVLPLSFHTVRTLGSDHRVCLMTLAEPNNQTSVTVVF